MTLPVATAQRLASLTLLACLFLGTAATPAEAATVGEIRTSLEQRINRSRTAHGLRRIRVNVKIERHAQGHADLMGDLNSMFHDSAALWNEMPDGREWCGENVGYVPDGRGAARRMHRAYMNSAGHKANILKARATHMGIGVVKRNGYIWTVERFADLW